MRFKYFVTNCVQMFFNRSSTLLSISCSSTVGISLLYSVINIFLEFFCLDWIDDHFSTEFVEICNFVSARLRSSASMCIVIVVSSQ